MSRSFSVENIEDPVVRDNFQKLTEMVTRNPFLNGNFSVFDAKVGSATSAFRIYHGLGYIPQDVIITYISNGAEVSVNHESTNHHWLEFNVSEPCSFRFLAGAIIRRGE